METPTPIPSPLTNPEKPSVIKAMPKTSYIIVAVIVTIASAVLIAWAFFKPVPSTELTSKESAQASKQATQSAQDKNFPKVPVNIGNPAVKEAFITYKLTGTIKTVKQVPGTTGKLRLFTDIPGSNLPKLFVSPQTTISRVADSRTTKVSLSDLAPNQKVDLVIIYRLKKKSWSDVQSVDIVSPTTISPSNQ